MKETTITKALLSGSPLFNILLISFIIRAFRDRVNRNGYSNGYSIAYYLGFYMFDDLTINVIQPTRNGKKKFYLQLEIPHELRVFEKGRRQKKFSCGRNITTYAQAKALINGELGQKIRNKVLEWRANFDPLLVSAERLLEALYCRFNEEDKKLPEKDWLTGEVTKKRLQHLQTLGEKDSPERKEYDLLVNLLRMEVFKVLSPKVPIGKGNQLTDYEGVRALLYKEFTDEDMRKIVDELVDSDRQDADLDFFKTRTRQGIMARPPTYGEKRNPNEVVNKKYEKMDNADWEQMYGVSAEDIEQIRRAYKIIVTKFNSEKQDRVSTANAEFDIENFQKRTGKGRVGKKYSDAVDGYWKQPERDSTSVSTEQEYKRGQDFFLNELGDLDLAQIDMSFGIEFINLLVKKKKGRSGKIIARASIHKLLSGMRAPITFAIGQNWLDRDPLFGIGKFVDKRGEKEIPRDIFSYEQRIAFFSNQDIPKQEMFLARALATSGMRMEEVCQLEFEDIGWEKQFNSKTEKEEQILCYNLTRVGLKLKTDSARRIVPIHQTFIPYLDQYVADRWKSKKPSGRLFDYKAEPKSGKFSNIASKELNPFVKLVRTHENQPLVAHSFRGTFTTICDTAGMEESIRKYIGGWTQQGTDKNYLRHREELASVRDIFNKINFDFIHGGE